ncbi:MAG: phosphoadenosine phosphosulfate reductase family protein [Oscillospiraceae bacterium]|nr:phosphoadenosine phosphosulfate reductase family protein [Oscillospiraceae bacterium]
MSSLFEKEKIAIERLRAFEPESEPYYLCYSGGKDSDCIRILAKLAGVRHEIHHNLTTVDTPETMQYIKSIPDVQIDKALDKDGNHVTMWNLIVKKKMPPTRLIRYCCTELKEQGGKGKLKITGVRKSESVNRNKNGGLVKILKKPVTVQKVAEQFGADYEITPQKGIVLNMDNDSSRRLVEHCYRTTSIMVNPIIDWTDDDVWNFLHHYGCQANPLYQCGRKRIGCIGCPMQGGKGIKKEFAEYPKYKSAYIRAFDKMVKAYPERVLNWKTGLDVYKWWVGDDPNQLSFFEEE